jgi:hypothetical protein
MLKRISDTLRLSRQTELAKGLGVADVPYEFFGSKKPMKSSDLKEIVNKVFLPRVQAIGFKGKDFYFYRQNETYTEVIFFWTYETGGAVQIDLLVKFNNVIYPTDKGPIKPQHIKPTCADFQRRLSPNGEQNKNGQEAWFWIFYESLERCNKIVEDIWRVFSIRGIEYFEKFKNHQQYIIQATPANCLDFPDFSIQRFFGRSEAGIIYFLFVYWRQMKDHKRAIEFAKLGMGKLTKPHHASYLPILKII